MSYKKSAQNTSLTGGAVTEERWTSYCCPISIVNLTNALGLSVNDLIMSHVVYRTIQESC